VITQNFFLQRKKIAGILLLVKTKKKRFVKKKMVKEELVCWVFVSLTEKDYTGKREW